MGLLTASAVDCIVPRGTHKILKFEVFDEFGNIYNLAGHTGNIFLYRCMHVRDLVLAKEGVVFDALNGRLYFYIEPEETEELMVRSYDASVIITNVTTGEFWPAFDGTIAVIPSPGGEEVG